MALNQNLQGFLIWEGAFALIICGYFPWKFGKLEYSLIGSDGKGLVPQGKQAYNLF